MSKLLIQSGPQEGAVLDLRPGLNRVGRREDNDIRIEDDSVSGHHCELTPGEGALHVRDLGSTNGTFVEGQAVEDGWLRPGQTLLLGQVAIVYEPAVHVQAEVEPPPPPALPSGMSPCFDHPVQPAEWVCGRCHRLFCAGCAIARNLAGKTLRFCPRCGGQCMEYGLGGMLKPKPEPVSFFRSLPRTFKYPLTSNGLAVILGGGLFFSFLEYLQSRAGIFSLFILLFSGGYLFAFLENAITTSARGDDTAPTWPEFSDWYSDIISPCLHWVALIAVCLGPAIFLFGRAGWTFMDTEEVPLGTLLAATGFGLAGLLYLPMALLAVAMADSIMGMSPLVVIPSICRLPLQYAVVVGILLVTTVLEFAVEWGLRWLEVPILSSVIAWWVFLYCVLLEVRVLGLLYFSNQERLGWFKR